MTIYNMLISRVIHKRQLLPIMATIFITLVPYFITAVLTLAYAWPVHVLIKTTILSTSTLWNLMFPPFVHALFPLDNFHFMFHFLLYIGSIYMLALVVCESLPFFRKLIQLPLIPLSVPELLDHSKTSTIVITSEIVTLVIAEIAFYNILTTLTTADSGLFGTLHNHFGNVIAALFSFIKTTTLFITNAIVKLA